MYQLYARHEVHSPIYNKWFVIKAPYASPITKAKDVTMHVLEQSPYEDPKYLLLLLIWASLYDQKYYKNSSHVCRKHSIGSGSLGSQEFVAAILVVGRITSMKSGV